jgi:hypothetical protein
MRMGNLYRSCLLLAVVLVSGSSASEAPDGSSFLHKVISIDGPQFVRIQFCGLPMQILLANIQFRSGSEKECLAFLKERLKPGTTVRIETEAAFAEEGLVPPPVHIFVGRSHMNAEIVRLGLAISDGRSQKYGTQMQASQMEAMEKKIGLWATNEKTSIAIVTLTPNEEPVVKSSQSIPLPA